MSPPARKAYLRTVLFAATSVFLLGISSVAYALLYYNYVPQVGIERAVHLQFGYVGAGALRGVDFMAGRDVESDHF